MKTETKSLREFVEDKFKGKMHKENQKIWWNNGDKKALSISMQCLLSLRFLQFIYEKFL